MLQDTLDPDWLEPIYCHILVQIDVQLIIGDIGG